MEKYEDTIAAVMTGKGTGAISTVQVWGEKAQAILKNIFKSQSGKSDFSKGKVLVGHIFDGEQIIDQVTIGCEGEKSFAINCHGNPLIVTNIIKLLEKNGARPVAPEQMICREAGDKGMRAIEIEAKLSGARAKTLAGSKIIANQVSQGLSKTAANWLSNIERLSVEEIQADAKKILNRSAAARYIIDGVKVVIAGLANSGKSTLLNTLCGREKAIVSDIKGTTRDWIEGNFKIDGLWVDLVDTAGLGEHTDSIDKVSQEKSIELLETADIVLIVVDGSDPESRIEKGLLERSGDKKIVVLNKSDLTALPNIDGLGNDFVKISAKTGDGLEELKAKIIRLCGVEGFDPKAAVCFTDRQKRGLVELAVTKTKKQAIGTITELLMGQIVV